VHQAERDRAKGEWGRPAMLRASGSLEGLRLVVLGFGNIGREAALRARAFGMKVTGIARSPRREELAEQIVGPDQLRAWLPQADVLLIAAPLNSGTRGLIGAAELALMKPASLVVNVARGEIVSETALAEALAAGRLAGAGIDVFDTEPLPKEHPFWALGNVILTPHTAGFGSTAGFGRMAAIVGDNAQRLIAGQPLLHVVDMDAK
jgi:phosphoglycerate dehydrogenase-like enzyme